MNTFGAAVSAMCLRGLSKAESIAHCATHLPTLYKQYRESGCAESLTACLDKPGNFPALVNAHAEKYGKTKAQAVEYAVKNFPESYSAWRKSGFTQSI